MVIATDDDRIREVSRRVRGRGRDDFGEPVATAPNAAPRRTEVLGGGYEIVVNLQGDAPLTPHWFVEDLIAGLARRTRRPGVATPVLRCDGDALNSLLKDRKA